MADTGAYHNIPLRFRAESEPQATPEATPEATPDATPEAKLSARRNGRLRAVRRRSPRALFHTQQAHRAWSALAVKLLLRWRCSATNAAEFPMRTALGNIEELVRDWERR